MRIRKAFIVICILLLATGCGGKETATALEPDTVPSVTAAPATPVPATAAPGSTPKEVSLSVHTPTPTPSPVPTPSPTPVPFVGEWSCSLGGEDILLTLETDGTGSVLYKGVQKPFSWAYADGKLILTGERSSFEAHFSAGTLSIVTSEGSIILAGKERS